MDQEQLKDRTRRFAVSLIAVCEQLPRRRSADVLARQLIRSATSVGANYRAACRARSRAEFVAKLGVVEEEADETAYWLDLLESAHLLPAPEIVKLKREADEILRIVVASIRTARRNQTDSRRQTAGTKSPPQPESSHPEACNPKSEIRNPQ